MKEQYKIFYSWQSDNDDARKSLSNAIDAAIKQLKDKDSIIVERDEATRGESGFVNIEDVVRQKIEQCDVFVCDITPVANIKRKKCLPNANVLFELGYACSVLNSHSIIAVGQKGGWSAANMPFDFNHHSIVSFDPLRDSLYDSIRDSIFYSRAQLANDLPMYFSNRQIERNLQSGKYLPDTFVEVAQAKERLRSFVVPADLYSKFYESAERMNFDIMNAKLRGKIKPAIIKANRKLFNKNGEYALRITQFDLRNAAYDMPRLEASIERLKNKLSKDNELLSSIGNAGYLGSSKMKWLARDMEDMQKRIFLLTSDAGQGKTNFLCDLTQNVLIKRGIPYVYLNGYEIDGANIAGDIAKEIYFLSDKSLDYVFDRISNYCSKQHRHFIIIIDGLNENGNLRVFAPNLVRLLRAVLQYSHVRVIMTCRTAYYEHNFEKLLSIFAPFMIKVNLDPRRHEEELVAHILIDRYLEHFNINATFSAKVKETFGRDKLLFRMFCEANKNTPVGFVPDIRREELFSKYYEAMSKEIAKRIGQELYIEVKEKDIKEIISHIVSEMMKVNNFGYVQLDTVRASIPDHLAPMFERFIYESTLVMTDLVNIEGDKQIEAITFTYDQFRDYRVAHYLIDDVFSKEKETFITILQKLSDNKSRFAEGLKQYMFIYAKNMQNEQLDEIFNQQIWYKDSFKKYIWDVQEDRLSASDIAQVKTELQQNPKHIARMLVEKGRWDTKKYPKLNILLLFEVLDVINDKFKFLSMIWSTNREMLWNGETGEYRDRGFQYLVNLGRSFIKNDGLRKSTPESINIFRLLSYFSDYEEEVEEIINRYNDLTKE